MFRKRLFWRLFLSYVVLTVVSVGGVALFSLRSIYKFTYSQVEAGLEDRAGLLKSSFKTSWLKRNDISKIDEVCKRIGGKSATRVTVFSSDGKLLGDSHMSEHYINEEEIPPEVVFAMNGDRGVSIRRGPFGERNLFVALPLWEHDTVVGVIRTSLPLTPLEKVVLKVVRRISIAGFLIAVLLASLSLIYTKKILYPLEEIRKGADRFSRGDLEHLLPVEERDEIGEVAVALNKMAEQLHERIDTIVRQHTEQQAVFSSMVEGVLALDPNGKIIDMNRAAASLFGVNVDAVRGMAVGEVIKDVDLNRFVGKVLEGHTPVEGEIAVRGNKDKYLQVHGNILKDKAGRNLGVLIVLNDVTKLRKLENVRREFVANVSHELKTPLTSIKGFVEALLDGAVSNKKQARSFLQIIARQVERLNAIIEDLLRLSRLEQEQEKEENMKVHSLEDIVSSAVEVCKIKAEEKKISLSLECSDKRLFFRCNSSLIEHAIVNLIDNAVKYSPEGGDVRIKCFRSGGDVVVEVSDNGPGIEREHLPRIFERFYRVDKARSRKMGGTGLGLAIVKHIVEIHKGKVKVDSTPGEGSRFILLFPGIEE